MKVIAFDVSDDVYEKLQDHCFTTHKRTGATIPGIVQQAIAEWLDKFYLGESLTIHERAELLRPSRKPRPDGIGGILKHTDDILSQNGIHPVTKDESEAGDVAINPPTTPLACTGK